MVNLFVAFLITFLSTVLFAEEETPTTSKPITLYPLATDSTIQGTRPSMNFNFEAPDANNSTLHLNYSLSELAPANSKLHLSLDGKPIKSLIPERSESPETLSITLGKLAGGFHLIKITGDLKANETNCLSDPRPDIWLNISNDSSLTFNGVHQYLTSDSSLKEFLTLHPIKKIVFNLPLTSHTFPLYLDAVHALKPNKASIEPSTINVMQLSDVKDNAQKAYISSIFETAELAPLAYVEISNKNLIVIPKKLENVSSIMAQLDNKHFQRTCRLNGCFMTNVVTKAPSPSSIMQSKNSDHVLTLNDIGYRHGLPIKNTEEQTINMVWIRPLGVQYIEQPEFHIKLKMTDRSLEKGAQYITLKLGDITLDSWSIETKEHKNLVLKTKIPQSFWSQDALDFEIQFSQESSNTQQCSADENVTRLLVKPDTGPIIKHHQEDLPGLAGFMQKTKSKKPLLKGDLPQDWKQAETAAILLRPFAKNLTKESWKYSKDKLCSTLCLTLNTTAANEEQWIPPSLLPGLPLIPSHSTHIYSLTDPKNISIRLAEKPLVMKKNYPPLSTALGKTIFLQKNTWIKTEHSTTIFYSSEPPNPMTQEKATRLKSNDENVLQKANFFWFAFISLGLLGGFIYRFRASQTREGKHFSKIENLKKSEEDQP